jgi:hypothetical protein
MGGEEWEVLELAGVHFFVFSLVPVAWYESQPKPVELVGKENENLAEIWWEHYKPPISIVDHCDGWLVRADSSPYDYGLLETVWEDKNHHRVELWESAIGEVAHLDTKIDARYPYTDFLAKVIELSVRANCLLFFTYEGRFVQPSSVAVFEALNRSPASCLARKEIVRSKNH